MLEVRTKEIISQNGDVNIQQPIYINNILVGTIVPKTWTIVTYMVITKYKQCHSNWIKEGVPEDFVKRLPWKIYAVLQNKE